jgi:hypothetical protein
MKHRLALCLYLILLSITFFASACSPQNTPTPFRPPTQPPPTQFLPTTTPVPALYTPVPTVTVTATVVEACANNLEFLQDITIPDDTIVSFGSTIDKQWLVKNNGTCNWDATYHLIWIGGDPLSATQEQMLFPAKAGTQATLQILFTAPAAAGTYESSWQAYGPDGSAFGDPIYMKVIVQ